MRLVALSAILVLSTVAARATTIIPADLNQLTASAEAVVYARVTDVRAVVTDDRRRVESIVVAEALAYMKGDMGRTIVFRVPGGQVGAYRTVMVGAPSFERGEEVVLFFGRQPSARPYLVGFSQGVYRVRADERTGLRMVSPPPAINTGVAAPLKRGSRAPMTLQAFASHVRTLVAAQSAAR